jgi:outer membrane immunogenic protein
MRTLIATLIASTVSIVAFQAAHAADAIDDIPQAPAADYAEPVASGNWAGGYAGGTASWQRSEMGGAKGNSLGGGVYGGYNMQDGQMVYGGEADLNYSGVDTHNRAAGLTTKQGVNGSLRGRVGIDLNPVLLYGTAGLAAANVEVKNNAGAKDDRNALGWTAGVGAEAFVTNNITARVEYRYTDYQKKNYDVGGTRVRAAAEDHSVRVGLGVKF